MEVHANSYTTLSNRLGHLRSLVPAGGLVIGPL